jgi:hypothetical protein
MREKNRGLQMFSPKFNPDLEKIDTKQEKLPGLNAVLETFAKVLILDMIETNLPILIKVSEKVDENFVFPITFLPVNFPGTPLKVYVGGEVNIVGLTFTQDFETTIKNAQKLIDHLRGKNKETIECSDIFGAIGSIVMFSVNSGFLTSAAQSSLKSGRWEYIAKFFEGAKNLLGTFLILTSICLADVVEIDINKLIDNFQGWN